MDKAKTTPKDFFMWAGAMVALYVGVFNFIALLWDYINFVYPDPLQYYPVDPYQGGISWEMATLIVLTPVFLILMWLIHRSIKADHSRREIWVRRWALYLTLFIAGVTMAVDLIYVLYAFLNGTDLTIRFLLKALIVLLVTGIGFMHFLADLWGFWEEFPERQRYVSFGTAALVIVSILAGFLIVGTPAQARLYRFDGQKVTDLEQIQSELISYYQRTGKLPATLLSLNDPISGLSVPADPQGQPYTYTQNSPLTFQLCATFNTDSGNRTTAGAGPRTAPMGVESENWQHGSGVSCFIRTIDPALYPPIKKTP